MQFIQYGYGFKVETVPNLGCVWFWWTCSVCQRATAWRGDVWGGTSPWGCHELSSGSGHTLSAAVVVGHKQVSGEVHDKLYVWPYAFVNWRKSPQIYSAVSDIAQGWVTEMSWGHRVGWLVVSILDTNTSLADVHVKCALEYTDRPTVLLSRWAEGRLSVWPADWHIICIKLELANYFCK